MKCLAEYDKLVTFKRITGQTADAHGQIDQTVEANWSTYAKSYCAVQTKGGREFWKVQQVNADVSHVWRTQWSKTIQAITPDMRLIHEGNTYEILSVIDIDLAHQEIEIQTRRAVQ